MAIYQLFTKNKLMYKRAIPLIIFIIVASLFFVIFFGYKPEQKISSKQYSKDSVSFSYTNKWQLNDESKDNTKSIILNNKYTASRIIIEIKKIPYSYNNYTLSQISESVKLKIAETNPNSINIYSKLGKFSKYNIQDTEMLYETKDKKQQFVVLVSKNTENIFTITMISPRDSFDLAVYDLDNILNDFMIK
jgi:hypothetical protein